MKNNSDSKGKSSGGIGFFGALFIAFLVMKLTGVVSWSWWWVTAPLWGSFILAVVLIVLGAVIDK